MPSVAPLDGRCGAEMRERVDRLTGKVRPAGFCKNRPEPGHGRCRFHGGMAKAKHSLYAYTLANAWPDDYHKSAEMFKTTPATVSLENEIKVARIKIARYQVMLAKGETMFEYVRNEEVCEPTDGDVPPVPCSKPVIKHVSVEYLLERAMDQLRRLVKTQHDMLPGAEVGGNLRVAVVIVGGDGKVRPRVPQLADDDAEVMKELADLESLKPKAFLKREPEFDGGYKEGEEDEEPDA